MARAALAQPMSGTPAPISAAELWPELSVAIGESRVEDEHGGWLPPLPSPERPPWLLLDPAAPCGLTAQLAVLLGLLGPAVPEHLPPGAQLDTSRGAIHIHPTASLGAGVVIEGPSYIGPHAELRPGACIRPHTWVCSQAVVGHASEIKHSLLLPGAKAPHFNYVGDSLLGPGVNLGAGVKLSNLRHDGRAVRLRAADAVWETGLRKFGAILGSDVQLGCNAVANPGVVMGVGALTWPNAVISGVVPAGARVHVDGTW